LPEDLPMSQQAGNRCRLRVVFFGMGGAFMTVPMKQVARGHDVVGLVLSSSAYRAASDSASRSTSPLRALARALLRRPTPSIEELREKHSFTILDYDEAHLQKTIDQLRALAPDICCVAGFPRLLPTEMLSVPRHGFVNVHPSLLPCYRGANPFFWAFHDQVSQTGVSIHVIDEGEDTGRVLAQERIEVPFGMTGQQLVREATRRGARLLREAIDSISVDEEIPLIASDCPSARRARRPELDREYVDWEAWSCQRVFHFLRGVMPYWYTPPSLKDAVPGGWIAMSIHPADDDASPLTLRAQSRWVEVRCSDGWIRFKPQASVRRLLAKLRGW